MKMLFIDVRKAHLNGICEEEVFVELPEEAQAPGKCGRLRRWLYGMRGAAQGWEKNYKERMQSIGLKPGKSTTAAFFDEESETRLVVHGDDFTFLGYPEQLEKIEEQMKEWYEVKVRGWLGSEPGDCKRISILNMDVTWDGEKITYTADSKHAKTIIEEMSLKEGSTGLKWPCTKEEVKEDEEQEVSKEEAKHFRKVAARANYLGMDRMDIQFAVK